MNLKIYTASKFERYQEVREFNQRLREIGHEVTHDWTLGDEFDSNGHPLGNPLTDEERAYYAEVDWRGATHADLVILLDDERANGALWECGMAIGAGKTVWIVDQRRSVLFDALFFVYQIPSKEEALIRLSTSNFYSQVLTAE